jgi:hypothetical protein
MSEEGSEHSPVKPASRIFQEYPRALLAIIPFCTLLLWLGWGATSHFWAVWAGAIGPDGASVPSGTTAAGAWGDSFGGFNALVGVFGTTAVAATLYLQYKSMEEQKKDQHLIRFEDNFFRLVDLLRSLRNDLVYEQTSKFVATKSMYVREGEHRAHAAIESAYNEINYWTFKFHHGRKIKKKSIIASQYENYVHSRYEFCFSPYFRILYTILNKISEDGNLNPDQKAYYANILRSQLTSFEVGLMAFNATSKYSKDLARLITEFRFLKYLPGKRRSVLGDVFNDKAYQARN